ncbi:hypothetical protein [Cohnella panacarvi]|uniref:hypothetical protein n=1 Tax=Cohnella panacarvi TaxID=400776 RepID=UPI00047CEEC7|nr:hypothetical protein [Cohnella panacarvi]
MQLRTGQSLLLLSHARNVAAANDTGWASIVESLLESVYPELGIRVDALSYATVTDGLTQPVWMDVARNRRPEWLVMPPLTRADLSTLMPDEATRTPERLKHSLLRMLHELSMYAERVVLFTPFDLTASDGNDFAPFEAAVLEAASEAGCMLVSVKSALDETKIKHACQPDRANDDALHTDIEFALANAFLRSVGFQWLRRPSFFSMADQTKLRVSHTS